MAKKSDGESGESGKPEGRRKDRLEVFREEPVGTNDPNIVGDVGPYDIPPGSDRRSPDEFPEVIDLNAHERVNHFDYE